MKKSLISIIGISAFVLFVAYATAETMNKEEVQPALQEASVVSDINASSDNTPIPLVETSNLNTSPNITNNPPTPTKTIKKVSKTKKIATKTLKSKKKKISNPEIKKKRYDD